METAEEPVTVPMDKLARVYRKMQARIQELTREYETQVEEIKTQQEAIKHAIKDQMLALGVTSMKTEVGTLTLVKKTRYQTNDWDSFKEFVKEHDALDLLQRSIAQKNMGLFLEENPGLVPPGLNTISEYGLSVTKPRK